MRVFAARVVTRTVVRELHPWKVQCTVLLVPCQLLARVLSLFLRRFDDP